MSHALALANLSILSKAQRPGKASKTKQKQTTSLGFGVERKEPPWRCVEGCGACCKLDKDPSFGSPEEIFTNPSDIQVCILISLRIRFCFYHYGFWFFFFALTFYLFFWLMWSCLVDWLKHLVENLPYCYSNSLNRIALLFWVFF